MLVQRSTIVALEKLCRCRRVLYDNWEGCGGTAEYYMSSWGAVRVQWSITETLVRRSLYTRVLHDYLAGCFGTVEYYKRTAKAVLVHGILQEHLGGCVGIVDYKMNTREAVQIQKSITGVIGRLCWYSREL